MSSRIPVSETVVESPASEPGEGGSFPPHLVPLPGERWGLWQWFCLRGAGFPAEQVLRLAAPAAAAAAERVLDAEEALEARRQEAIDQLRDGLDDAGQDERFARLRAIGRLNKGRLPRARDARGPAVDAFAQALEDREVAAQMFEQAFASGLETLGHELREIAADDRFRQAVAWQNRHALETGADSLLRQPAGGARNSQERQHEQMVTSYLHRYCTKNDSIGWFGPVGWGRFSTRGEPIVARPGETLTEAHIVRFENWCVDEVAAALLGDEALRPWWKPRVMPFFVLRGNVYIPVQGAPRELDRRELAVFKACDGRRTALRLAEDLAQRPELGFEDREAVLALLGTMAGAGMILWQPELPMVRRPERVLRQMVESIDDPALREPRLARVEELENHRDTIAAATTAADLQDALEHLEEWFSDLTGAAATRLAGKPYAGRTLIHEDCRRNIQLDLGPELLETLGPPLSLVLRTARWFTYELSRRWSEELTAAYREAVAESGDEAVPLFRYFQRIRPLLLKADVDLVKVVADELRERWTKLLDLEGDVRRVDRDSAELDQRAKELFPAPGPGWRHAREQCPDILISASSEEAIRRGDYHFVLGEVHLATNTIRTRLFAESHPDPAVLLDAFTRDIPEPTVLPWLPRRRSGEREDDALGIRVTPTSGRLDFGLLSAKDLRVSIDLEPPANPEVETAFIGDFAVVEGAGELRVRSFDGRHDFDIMEFLDIAFSAQTINSFRVLGRGRHVPRITIDRLVVQRETWRLPVVEVPFASAKSEAERFLGTRRWARELGLPRFVFARSPYENKPFFVDFDSPPAVEIFCRIARRALERGGPETNLSVSEMLPDVSKTWLRDAQGQRFTSELRVVAVDLAPGGANADHPILSSGTEER
ncbi:MAG: lantibiotic dehydratase [Acidobacteria bacterium]|nr:lantibiotic dehydratase [Acidobacteriota bacterium]